MYLGPMMLQRREELRPGEVSLEERRNADKIAALDEIVCCLDQLLLLLCMAFDCIYILLSASAYYLACHLVSVPFISFDFFLRSPLGLQAAKFTLKLIKL